MAGGMRTGRGLTLAERSALSGVVPDRSADQGRRRHCWVAAPSPDRPACPGLVLDWQRTDAGWRAYVVYLRDFPADGSPGGVAVQEWVDAARLRPAATSSQ
jgi:hypothetical protein